MPLQQLESYQFRNLKNPNISFDSGLSIIFGNNASGKTSLLEAIHVLCSGKSFLSASPAKLQQFGTNDFSINGQLTHDPQKHHFQYLSKDRRIHLKIDNNLVTKVSQYALLQPVQAITPSSFLLLDDSPDRRRRFIDWGVFHVKHAYIDSWHEYQRSLQQRNATLRQGHLKMLDAWDVEYTRPCLRIDQYREGYIEDLSQRFSRIIRQFMPEHQVSIQYHRGWPENNEFETLLRQSREKDVDRGYTFYGPHRAELSILLDERPARDTASRGQKKLIAYALYIAQAELQQIRGKYSGILLVDDLPSELDNKHQKSVIDLLAQQSMQVVMTCIDLEQIEKSLHQSAKVFHVKQGMVQEVLQ